MEQDNERVNKNKRIRKHSIETPVTKPISIPNTTNHTDYKHKQINTPTALYDDDGNLILPESEDSKIIPRCNIWNPFLTYGLVRESGKPHEALASQLAKSVDIKGYRENVFKNSEIVVLPVEKQRLRNGEVDFITVPEQLEAIRKRVALTRARIPEGPYTSVFATMDDITDEQIQVIEQYLQNDGKLHLITQVKYGSRDITHPIIEQK